SRSLGVRRRRVGLVGRCVGGAGRRRRHVAGRGVGAVGRRAGRLAGRVGGAGRRSVGVGGGVLGRGGRSVSRRRAGVFLLLRAGAERQRGQAAGHDESDTHSDVSVF